MALGNVLWLAGRGGGVLIGHQPSSSLFMGIGYWSPSASQYLSSWGEDLKVRGQILVLFDDGLGTMSSAAADPLLKGGGGHFSALQPS